MDKVRWADMTDDDPIPAYELEEPTVISKHGIRIKKDVPPRPEKYVPPHRQDKTVTPVKGK
jgi:hypothetical protein